MDGQLAGPTDPELKKLTDRFVRVKLIQMGGVDLATFQFDPFLSWAVFFMNGDKTIYGRYGRAHPQTKRSVKDSNPNHTVDGMKAALARALEIHEGYTRDPETWGKALAGKTGPEPRWRFAEKSPAALKYKRLKRIKPGSNEHGCVHCHEVHRTAIDSYFMKKIPLPDNMLWLYPRPHVLGLAMDKNHCARVTGVTSGSVAAKRFRNQGRPGRPSGSSQTRSAATRIPLIRASRVSSIRPSAAASRSRVVAGPACASNESIATSKAPKSASTPNAIARSRSARRCARESAA